MSRLALTLHDFDGPRAVGVSVMGAVIAGWAGRDAAQVQAHIDELAAIGVPPPAEVPCFYRVAASRLTLADRIECTGTRSSGEAECVLLRHAGRFWVGAGSDHTDRLVETYDITVSKQMCDKPLSGEFWPLLEVAGHWDRLELRAWADGTLYQDGAVSGLREPTDLASRFGGLGDDWLMFCGTLPVQGGVRPASSFRVELHDPVLHRTIRHTYAVDTL